MPATHDELVAIALAHAGAETGEDLAPVLDTLESDCVYELQPVGRVLRGLDLARRYYEHFFAVFRPLVAGYTMRSEWSDELGLGQEYTIWTSTAPDGGLERHEVIGVLTFGTDKLSGERVYGSERLLRLMFGPLYDETEPVEAGSPPD